MSFTEDMVEQVALDVFRDLGWEYADPLLIGPDGKEKARGSYGEVYLRDVFADAAQQLNPDIPQDVLEGAIKQLTISETPSLIEENRRIHRLLVDGIDVEYRRPDGSIKGDKVRLIDFGTVANNVFTVTNQFTVVVFDVNAFGTNLSI